MNERVLAQISRYIHNPSCKYSGSFKKSEEVAISIWAATELKKEIRSSQVDAASDVISDFRDKMLYFSTISETGRQRNLFKIAANTADEILSMI